MKIRYKYFIAFIFAFSFSVTYAMQREVNSVRVSSDFFIENKGQIHDQNLIPNAEVKYLFSTIGMNVELTTNGFSYDTYTSVEENNQIDSVKVLRKNGFPKEKTAYLFHRVDVEFVDANSSPVIVGEGISTNYFNYYTTGVGNDGATNIRSYSKIIYENLYPNIDLEFTISEGKLKYNFILHYGANIDLIKWKYNGAESSIINEEHIEIDLEQKKIIENIPESFVTKNSLVKRNANIIFCKRGEGIYGFRSKESLSMANDENLIIDPTPTIVWSTYKGGTGDEVLGSTCTDTNGNIFVSGWTNSPNSIATTGSYQVAYGLGNYDGTFMKYNSNGNLIWSTYFGGNGEEQAAIITMDKFSNLFVAGPTTSTTSISTIGSYQSLYGGGTSDCYLAKFDTNGVRIWCTYFGGTAYDDLYGCATDIYGNIFISGSTTSLNAISTIGAHQLSFGGGLYDVFLEKFDSTGMRQWGTYYGGMGDDVGVNCIVDNSQNIYLTGATSSVDSISTTGSQQPIFGGGSYDGFLTKFNSNGVRQWGTYYGGLGMDISQWVYYDTLDGSKGLYITGSTYSSDSIATISSYQNTNNGGGDAFLVKFDTSGTRLFGTYYGGIGYEGGNCITSDSAGIYCVGLTQSILGVSTSNAMQTTYGSGSGDGFIAKFSKGGAMQWSTYFGGTYYDLCNGTTMDNLGNLIVVGTTGSNGMATVGAEQSTNGGGPHDGFCTKFNQLIATGINEEPLLNNFDLTIIPNPFSISSTLVSYKELKNATLIIYNSLGQEVKKIKNISGHSILLERNGLSNGVYVIRLTQDDEVIGMDRIIITD